MFLNLIFFLQILLKKFPFKLIYRKISPKIFPSLTFSLSFQTLIFHKCFFQTLTQFLICRKLLIKFFRQNLSHLVDNRCRLHVSLIPIALHWFSSFFTDCYQIAPVSQLLFGLHI